MDDDQDYRAGHHDRRADQVRAARETFSSLNLPGWRERKQKLRPGAQAGVITVENDSGARGVFRCLTRTDKGAVERFYRELAILTDSRFRHPSVVEILEWTRDRDHQWYISRLGRPFKGWWLDFRKNHQDQPDHVLSTAIDLLATLSEGLAALHEAGVVHRDIKPDNIVMDLTESARPILIDFGIAYAEAAERLTPSDAAVANKRFSPDVMMNRMDRVPPWLDVFQLGQILIWMVSEPTATPHWDRPLDWRFVNYDSRLPDDLVLRIRSVTALCSEERISPQNGRDLASLLRERFPMTTPDDSSIPEIDASKIRSGIAIGKSVQDIAVAEDARMIEASASAVAVVYGALRDGLETISESLRRHALPIQRPTDASLEEFASTLTAGATGSVESTLYQLTLGDPSGQQFHFRVQCVVFVPSLSPHMNAPKLPATSNIVCLYLQRYANLTRVTFPHITRVVSVERDGILNLRTEQMSLVEQTDIPKLLAMVKNWLEDPVAWEMIQRDR